MCTGFEVALISAAASAGASYYQGEQQKKAGEKAAKQSQANADKQLAMAEAEANKQANKSPNTQGLYDENARAAREASGTMLTGPQGIDPNTLALGKNVLLGGM